MDSEELLAQLADIHLPEPVSFWPPAPGWWVLAVLLLIGLILFARWWSRHHAKQQVYLHAIAELDRCMQAYSEQEGSIDQRKLDYVNAVNSVLRRVALVHFPDSGVASLGGAEWVDFIRKNGDSSGLDDNLAAALSFGRFQTRCDVDVDALDSLGRSWLKSLYLDKPNPVATTATAGKS
jgi:hypothetical protein